MLSFRREHDYGSALVQSCKVLQHFPDGDVLGAFFLAEAAFQTLGGLAVVQGIAIVMVYFFS